MKAFECEFGTDLKVEMRRAPGVGDVTFDQLRDTCGQEARAAEASPLSKAQLRKHWNSLPLVQRSEKAFLLADLNDLLFGGDDEAIRATKRLWKKFLNRIFVVKPWLLAKRGLSNTLPEPDAGAHPYEETFVSTFFPFFQYGVGSDYRIVEKMTFELGFSKALMEEYGPKPYRDKMYFACKFRKAFQRGRVRFRPLTDLQQWSVKHPALKPAHAGSLPRDVDTAHQVWEVRMQHLQDPRGTRFD